MTILSQLLNKKSGLEKAIGWIKKHRIGKTGIVVHHKTKDLTPEVTGYLIESLYKAGEKELALDLARWEASIQMPDGSFTAPGVKTPYTFDTAQVIRGFLAVSDDMPHLKSSIFKACDFVVNQIDERGEIHTPSDEIWNLAGGGKLSHYCNLYCLTPLWDAGKKFGIPQYIEAAKHSLTFYKSKPDLTEFKPELGTLSHIFGYMMEALADLGEKELAQEGLAQAEKIQKPDGGIPAYPGAEWVCATGMAQLGLAWHKVGNLAQAERMLTYLEKIQKPSGGFYGGYGQGAEYFPEKEISWANKFFIDLYLLVRGRNE